MQNSQDKPKLKITDRILIKLVGYTNVDELVETQRQFYKLCSIGKMNHSNSLLHELTDFKKLWSGQLDEEYNEQSVKACGDYVC